MFQLVTFHLVVQAHVAVANEKKNIDFMGDTKFNMAKHKRLLMALQPPKIQSQQAEARDLIASTEFLISRK